MATEKNTATDVATESVILTGRDCRKIICLSNNNAYGRGKRQEQGKTYSQFRLGNIVFTVADDSPFVADHKNGNLEEVSLNKTLIDKKTIDEEGNEIIEKVPGLEFDYHFTKMQELSDAKHNAQMKAFATLASAPVTDDFLAQLLNNA
jgi:hypothetical protein